MEMAEKPRREMPAINKIEAYPLPRTRVSLASEDREDVGREKRRRMVVRCSECNKLFDSTFTIEDIANLPREGLESGTMHLCPYCGYLGLYLLKDYIEEKD
jgi:DNA-directed RNA polymerase subunit RPC12/RpoP